MILDEESVRSIVFSPQQFSCDVPVEPAFLVARLNRLDRFARVGLREPPQVGARITEPLAPNGDRAAMDLGIVRGFTHVLPLRAQLLFERRPDGLTRVSGVVELNPYHRWFLTVILMFTLLSAPLGIAAIAMIESGPKRISATFNLAVYLVGLFGTFAFSWPLMRRDAAMLTAFISEALSRAEGTNEDQLRD